MKPFIIAILFLGHFCSNIVAQSLVLSCDRPIEIYNNHVGHDWKYGFGVNRTFIPTIDPITVPMASIGSLEFIIQEMDQYTDQATVDLDIDPSLLQVNKLYSRTIVMIVTENAGEFKGNTAKWSVTIHYKKISSKA